MDDRFSTGLASQERAKQALHEVKIRQRHNRTLNCRLDDIEDKLMSIIEQTEKSNDHQTSTLIREVEDCLARHCSGVLKSNMPKDRAELKIWHRSGKVEDINNFTQSDIEAMTSQVVKIMELRK